MILFFKLENVITSFDNLLRKFVHDNIVKQVVKSSEIQNVFEVEKGLSQVCSFVHSSGVEILQWWIAIAYLAWNSTYYANALYELTSPFTFYVCSQNMNPAFGILLVTTILLVKLE
jgi:hypothetical protein